MTEDRRKLGLVIAIAVALAACGRTRLGIIGKDSGTTASDVAPARDVFAKDGPSPKDAAADAVTADARPDAPDGSMTQKETAKETAADGAGRDTASDGSGLPACTGTLVLGSLWPMTSVGRWPRSVALGDLNGDGRLDIVTASDWPGVSVSLGKGDGTFAAKTDYDADSPSSVALADLDGDGKLDIVAGRHYANTASVLLGKGDGTFAAKTDYATGKNPQSVALADLNGDGRVDIVTANTDAATVSVLLGKGDGTFASEVDYAIGDGPFQVALADLDGDGKLDIAAASITTVNVLLGKGDGTFAAKLETWAGYTLNAIALGDLNGDGKLDLVAAPSNVGPLGLLLGTGDGRFAAPIDILADKSAMSLAMSDLNGDGKLDIVVSDGRTLSLLFGRGDGTFPMVMNYPAATEPGPVALGDLNGDGKPDLIMLMGDTTGWVRTFLGIGQGPWFLTNPRYATGGYPTSVALGDLNGDGRLDAVTASSTTVSVLLGKSDGTFADKVLYPAGDGGDQAGIDQVAIGDLDGDGKLDVVKTSYSSATISVLLGTGDGALTAKVDYATAEYPNSMALADLNRDGKLDIVTSSGDRGFAAGFVSVLLGTGAGKFAAHVDYDVGSHPLSVALGDLNRDGKLDIVVANEGMGEGLGSSVSVLLGKGDGTFAAKVDYAPGSSPNWLALVDLDDDGKLDLATTSAIPADKLTVLTGKGDGTFATLPGQSIESNYGLALVDLNGDGRPDLVTGGHFWTTMVVLFGENDGTFSTSVAYPVTAWSVAQGDLNGDGRLDLVASDRDTDSVEVMLASCR